VLSDIDTIDTAVQHYQTAPHIRGKMKADEDIAYDLSINQQSNNKDSSELLFLTMFRSIHCCEYHERVAKELADREKKTSEEEEDKNGGKQHSSKKETCVCLPSGSQKFSKWCVFPVQSTVPLSSAAPPPAFSSLKDEEIGLRTEELNDPNDLMNHDDMEDIKDDRIYDVYHDNSSSVFYHHHYEGGEYASLLVTIPSSAAEIPSSTLVRSDIHNIPLTITTNNNAEESVI